MSEVERLRALLREVGEVMQTGWLPDGDSVGQNIPTVMYGEEILARVEAAAGEGEESA